MRSILYSQQTVEKTSNIICRSTTNEQQDRKVEMVIRKLQNKMTILDVSGHREQYSSVSFLSNE
jgi:DNA topoisomerase VI subunit B